MMVQKGATKLQNCIMNILKSRRSTIVLFKILQNLKWLYLLYNQIFDCGSGKKPPIKELECIGVKRYLRLNIRFISLDN